MFQVISSMTSYSHCDKVILIIICVPFNFCPEAENCSSVIRGRGRISVVIILSQNLNDRIS